MATAGYIDRYSLGFFGRPVTSRNWMASGILLQLRSGFRGVYRRLCAAGAQYLDEDATENRPHPSRVVCTTKMVSEEILLRNIGAKFMVCQLSQ